MSKDKYNYNYIHLGIEPYQFTDKMRCITAYIKYMLNRLQALFNYDGLPDTIPQRDLELLLQTNGHATITEVDGKLYALRGGLGGEPNPYYMPTVSVVSNPALKYSATLEIDKDCIIIPNDSMYMGLIPLLNRYCTSLVENDVTMNLANINMRLTTIITACDDDSKYSAEKYLQDLIDGKLGIMPTKAFVESIQTQPYASTGQGNQVTQLIEYEQYLKASLFNELGIQMNWNAKRESLGNEESGMNDQALMPLIEDMLQNRKRAIEKINSKYQTDIEVDYSRTWQATVDNIGGDDIHEGDGLPPKDTISEED